MLGWREAHVYDAGFYARVPAEIRSMMRPRSGAQQERIVGETFAQPLAPFLDPTRPSGRSREPGPWAPSEGSSAADHGAGRDRASILLPLRRLLNLTTKQTSFCVVFYPLQVALWFPFLRLLSLENLSCFDEPTQAGVTMTESRTVSINSGEDHNILMGHYQMTEP
jgi:hypothetical protein